MSRLYIRAKGSRSELTRTAVDHAQAEILYNFDGGGSAIGSLRLEADNSPDRSEIVYTVYHTNKRTGAEKMLSRWTVRKDSPEKVNVIYPVPPKQPKLF